MTSNETDAYDEQEKREEWEKKADVANSSFNNKYARYSDMLQSQHLK